MENLISQFEIVLPFKKILFNFGYIKIYFNNFHMVLITVKCI